VKKPVKRKPKGRRHQPAASAQRPTVPRHAHPAPVAVAPRNTLNYQDFIWSSVDRLSSGLADGRIRALRIAGDAAAWGLPHWRAASATLTRVLDPGLLPTRGREAHRAIARAARYYDEDRETVGLLLLPFLLMATAIAMSQALRPAALLGPPLAHEESAPPVLAAAPRYNQPVPLPSLPSAPLPDIERPPVLPPVAAVAPILPPAAAIPEIAGVEGREAEIALLPPAAGAADLSEGATALPELAVRDAEPEVAGPSARGTCVASASPKTAPRPASAPESPAAFGLRLAAAARAQLDDFVIYNDKYRNISYPMGDVPSLFGVCTDVVVRAYRALGLDLQALVHEARVGSGDTNIDHRRTEVLRRFFTARGASLSVTDFSEDYRPGDIVTYYRPQNRGSRSHIAIVSDVIAPSGRPMIIHNRGWGPQMEDALFVDRITGHYRYRGPGPAAVKSADSTAPTTESDPKSRL
jgi:uncharacterized protein YijF (DUF1287 family)